VVLSLEEIINAERTTLIEMSTSQQLKETAWRQTNAKAADRGRMGVIWCLLVLGVLLVKIAIYVIDPAVQFFFGDSRSYIHTALSGWAPPDRSYYYGKFIWLVTYYSSSLASLVITQILLTSTVCIALALVLKRFFRVRNEIAVVAALICAVEPVQLFYERSVMTESVSLFFLSAFVVVLLEYIEKSSYKSLLFAVVLGFLMIKFRTAYWALYLYGLLAVVVYNSVRKYLEFEHVR